MSTERRVKMIEVDNSSFGLEPGAERENTWRKSTEKGKIYLYNSKDRYTSTHPCNDACTEKSSTKNMALSTFFVEFHRLLSSRMNSDTRLHETCFNTR